MHCKVPASQPLPVVTTAIASAQFDPWRSELPSAENHRFKSSPGGGTNSQEFQALGQNGLWQPKNMQQAKIQVLTVGRESTPGTSAQERL